MTREFILFVQYTTIINFSKLLLNILHWIKYFNVVFIYKNLNCMWNTDFEPLIQTTWRELIVT